MLDLNKLRTFAAMYRRLSVTAAAKDLRVTPAAVSIALKRLEGEVDGALFTRVGRAFVTTPFGDRLYEVAVQFLDEIERVVEDAKPVTRALAGSVKIGAPSGFGARPLVALLAEFGRQFPAIAPVVRTGSLQVLLRLLLDCEIGLAIVGAGAKLGDVRQVVTRELSFGYDLRLVCSPSFFRSALGGAATVDRLAAAPHIGLFDMPTRLCEWYLANFRSAPRAKPTLTFDTVFGALAAVRLDQGLALLPSDVIAPELAAGELVTVGRPLSSPRFRYRLLQLNDRVPPAAEKVLISYLRESRGAEVR